MGMGFDSNNLPIVGKFDCFSRLSKKIIKKLSTLFPHPP